MKFGLDKCDISAMKRDKATTFEGIMITDEEVISGVSVKGHKYLGIMECGNIAHKEMKQKTRQEHKDRVWKIIKSRLNGRNAIKTVTLGRSH